MISKDKEVLLYNKIYEIKVSNFDGILGYGFFPADNVWDCGEFSSQTVGENRTVDIDTKMTRIRYGYITGEELKEVFIDFELGEDLGGEHYFGTTATGDKYSSGWKNIVNSITEDRFYDYEWPCLVRVKPEKMAKYGLITTIKENV